MSGYVPSVWETEEDVDEDIKNYGLYNDQIELDPCEDSDEPQNDIETKEEKARREIEELDQEEAEAQKEQTDYEAKIKRIQETIRLMNKTNPSRIPAALVPMEQVEEKSDSTD